VATEQHVGLLHVKVRSGTGRRNRTFFSLWRCLKLARSNTRLELIKQMEWLFIKFFLYDVCFLETWASILMSWTLCVGSILFFELHSYIHVFPSLCIQCLMMFEMNSCWMPNVSSLMRRTWSLDVWYFPNKKWCVRMYQSWQHYIDLNI
jgi:hypothetical protein